MGRNSGSDKSSTSNDLCLAKVSISLVLSESLMVHLLARISTNVCLDFLCVLAKYLWAELRMKKLFQTNKK